MRVMWLCNSIFSNEGVRGTGSWLQPLAEGVHNTGAVALINVTMGNVQQVVQQDNNGIKQWIIPIGKKYSYGQVADKITCEAVASIIKRENPDLVHIWGTESIWASIYQQDYIKVKALLDIQGLLFAYTDYYYGGLSIKEIFKSIYIKEILMPWRTLFYKKEVFRRRGLEEISCIKEFRYISYQSEWVKNQVLEVQPNARYYPTKIILRNSFYNASKWKYKVPTDAPVVFSSCSAAVSYKGLHVLIKAVALLKKRYPRIKLRLAGKVNVGNRLQDGYSIFLNRLIDKLGLKSNVVLVGSLNEHEIIDELLQANVCAISSFIETYCLAFAEAMMLGVPTTVSFAGAMPELASHKKEALFYNSADHVTCAAYINELIQNKNLAESISIAASEKRSIENSKTVVIENQILIYKKILEYN